MEDIIIPVKDKSYGGIHFLRATAVYIDIRCIDLSDMEIFLTGEYTAHFVQYSAI